MELDDFYLAARDRGKKCEAGRGTDEQPMVCAVERRAEERGRCVIRVVPDCSGKTYGRFAEEHVYRSAHVRSDGWGGITARLRGRRSSGWGLTRRAVRPRRDRPELGTTCSFRLRKRRVDNEAPAWHLQIDQTLSGESTYHGALRNVHPPTPCFKR